MMNAKLKVMWFLVVILIVVGVLCAVLKLLYKPSADGIRQSENSTSASCSTCSGASAKCEQECMMEASTRPVEYFDDEELDRFRGRESDSYTEKEVEEFAEVLHTMRQTEVADWCRSLTLRGVNLPDELKDEAFMLIEG